MDMVSMQLVLLESRGQAVHDVEICGANVENWPISGRTFVRLGTFINYSAIPVYLVQYHGLSVFTSNHATEEWFKLHLVQFSLKGNANVALMFHASDTYLVFYFDTHIKCTIVDLQNVERIDTCIGALKQPAIKHNVDTKIFDRILLQKKSKSAAVEVAPGHDPRQLSSQEQINQAVLKIVLSGLRIRGLSTNLSHMVNDKLTIKEIYQMTYKATLFSLRKHNYSFNKSTRPITVNELQDIVEKLLEIFVDV